MNDILPSTHNLYFLVGYFYFSGFQKLSQNLKDKNIKLLIGMDVEKTLQNTIKEFEVIQELHQSHGKVKQTFYKTITQLVNETEFIDSPAKEEAFRLFLSKIKDGSLEIRKTKKPNHAKLYLFENKPGHDQGGQFPGTLITGSSNLTRSGLAGQQEVNVVFRDRTYEEGKKLFDKLWKPATQLVNEQNLEEFTHSVVEKLYLDKHPKPFLVYLRVLDEFLAIEQTEIKKPAEITDYKYFDIKYQTDAILQSIQILEKHHGVLLTDVVGLGKSIIASAIAHNLGKRTIIVCPPHLMKQWQDFSRDFKIHAEIFSRGKIEDAVNVNIAKEEQVVIIDEAHKYKNEETEDYANLHKLTKGNKVLLLTATPFNNDPQDIFSMIKLFQIPSKSTIQTVDNLSTQFQEMIKDYKSINKAQRDRASSDSEIKERIQNLARKIRNILSPVLIRRSRLDLEKIDEYREDLHMQGIKLNKIHPPKLLEYELGNLQDLYFETLQKISPSDDDEVEDGFIGARYKPIEYLVNPQKYRDRIKKEFGEEEIPVTAQRNLAKFMKRLLVRRFESSVYAFQISLSNMIQSAEIIEDWYIRLGKVPIWKKGKLPDLDTFYDSTGDEAEELLSEESFDEALAAYSEKGLQIIEKDELKETFIQDVRKDIRLLKDIRDKWFGAGVPDDPKIDYFKTVVQKSLSENPECKIIVFSEFSDTVDYLNYKLKDKFRLFKYTSKDSNKTNKKKIELNFDAGVEPEIMENEYDILVATDAISEGYNLHRAGIIFNYDIPYNPTRVIQRVGRIDRINKKVFEHLSIYNFFPTATGEDEIRIKQITTLKISMINELLGSDTRTLSPDEEIDSYFKEQYKKEWKVQEEQSWDTEYRNLHYRVRMHQPELLEKAIEIARRTKIRRTVSKDDSGVLVFGRKGKDFVFRLGRTSIQDLQINPETALKLFEAELGENADKPSEQFDPIYQFVKGNLFKRKTQVELGGSAQNALDKLEVLKPKLSNKIDYIQDLIEAINLDSVPNFFFKKIRAIDERTLKNDFTNLEKILPHDYIKHILDDAEKIDEEKETIILSEELV